MSYNKEVFEKIKEMKEKIEGCQDPFEAVMLQSELLEILQNTLTDSKFKEELIKRHLHDNN